MFSDGGVSVLNRWHYENCISFKSPLTEVLTGLIKNISGAPGTGADYAAQVARGLLGFTKDAVLGVGELAYEAMKGVPKLVRLTQTQSGRLYAQLDAQILAENIKIGNLTPGLVGEASLNIGKSIVAPVIDPWKKGNYVESLTRGGSELGTLALGWLKGSKVKAAKAAGASKGASVAKSVAAGTPTGSSPKLFSVTGAIRGHADPGVHIKAKSAPSRKLSPFIIADRRKITKLSNEAADAQSSSSRARSLGDKDAAVRFDEIAKSKINEAREVLYPYLDNGDVNAVLDRLDVSSLKNGAHFWSGWADGALEKARELSSKIGGVSLESTPGGRVVNGWDELEKSSYPAFRDEFWPGLSEKYAAGAEGKIRIVQSDSAWSRGGGDVWKNVEMPQLLKQGKATEFEFVDLNGNIRQVVHLKDLTALTH